MGIRSRPLEIYVFEALPFLTGKSLTTKGTTPALPSRTVVLAARTVAGGARVVTVVSFVFEKDFPLITGDPFLKRWKTQCVAALGIPHSSII
jgi:hypothetical protein